MTNSHIHYEVPPEEEIVYYRRLYRSMLAFWLPLSAATGVIIGHFLI